MGTAQGLLVMSVGGRGTLYLFHDGLAGNFTGLVAAEAVRHDPDTSGLVAPESVFILLSAITRVGCTGTALRLTENGVAHPAGAFASTGTSAGTNIGIYLGFTHWYTTTCYLSLLSQVQNRAIPCGFRHFHTRAYRHCKLQTDSQANEFGRDKLAATGLCCNPYARWTWRLTCFSIGSVWFAMAAGLKMYAVMRIRGNLDNVETL